MLGDLGCVMDSSPGGHWNWVSGVKKESKKIIKKKKPIKVSSLQLHSKTSLKPNIAIEDLILQRRFLHFAVESHVSIFSVSRWKFRFYCDDVDVQIRLRLQLPVGFTRHVALIHFLPAVLLLSD